MKFIHLNRAKTGRRFRPYDLEVRPCVVHGAPDAPPCSHGLSELHPLFVQPSGAFVFVTSVT